MEIELNGFDEAGIIGENLRFTRVSINAKNSLRPFIYNLLHFGSVTATKKFLSGFPDENKADYVRTVLSDPAINVNHYVFSTTHQLDVLRKFTFLEEKQFYGQRRLLVEGILQKDESKIWKVADYIKRYARTPFWMESFVKSYGFRMIVEELSRTSKVLSNSTASDDYRVFTFVDGGYPFVFWWRSFLNDIDRPSCFSSDKTPIIGITNGDQYYPVVSMAGNIAFITNTVPGMIFPHNVKEVPIMDERKLKNFYHDFSSSLNSPKFHRRVLFFGNIYTQLQYLLPFIMFSSSSHKEVVEPFRLSYVEGGTLKSFYKTFGGGPKRDIIISGNIKSDKDQKIMDECIERGIDCQEITEYVPQFKQILDDILEEAKTSNLRSTQVNKIESRINKIKNIVDKI